MKLIKRIFAVLISGILGFPFMLSAQDEGTYIDNLGVQDSSYMEIDLLNEGQSSGSGTVIIIIAVIVVILAVVFFMMKKKKKK
jgi:LPXTG-motif cell wall-anchored protein